MTNRCGKKTVNLLDEKSWATKASEVTPKLVGLNKENPHPGALNSGFGICHDLLQKNAPPIQFLHVSMDTFVESTSSPPQKWWLEDPSGLVRLLSGANRSPARELSPYPTKQEVRKVIDSKVVTARVDI